MAPVIGPDPRITGYPRNTWYRNAGRGTAYHRASVDWARNGNALCGADISAPFFVFDGWDGQAAKHPRSGRPFCKSCLRLAAKRGA